MIARRSSLALFAAPFAASAQLKDILDKLGRGKTSGDKNASGIREALLTGVGNAIGLASKPDGFLLNLAIKILLPEKLKPVEKALRIARSGKLVDDLVAGMNRAAERAAPLAKDIFAEAIKSMTIADALGIVKGGDTSATDYFRKTSEAKLIAAFRPPVAESMQQVGVVKTYNELMTRFKAIPFVKAEALNLEDYVTEKAAAGLFHLIGEEEKKIRTNPAARVTPLLREVFGAVAR